MSKQPSKSKRDEDSELPRIPFDDALRKILSAPPAPKAKPKPKQKKKIGS
jgi:hypothetical protein